MKFEIMGINGFVFIGLFIYTLFIIFNFGLFLCAIRLFEFLPYNTLAGFIGLVTCGVISNLLDKKFPIK